MQQHTTHTHKHTTAMTARDDNNNVLRPSSIGKWTAHDCARRLNIGHFIWFFCCYFISFELLLLLLYSSLIKSEWKKTEKQWVRDATRCASVMAVCECTTLALWRVCVLLRVCVCVCEWCPYVESFLLLSVSHKLHLIASQQFIRSSGTSKSQS